MDIYLVISTLVLSCLCLDALDTYTYVHPQPLVEDMDTIHLEEEKPWKLLKARAFSCSGLSYAPSRFRSLYAVDCLPENSVHVARESRI